MAAKDLITLARAEQDIQNYVPGTNDPLIQTLITAVSEAIEKYCKRYFVARSFDELYNGDGNRRLLLRQYPVQSVQSVRYRPVTVIKIINNSASQQMQQARVQVTATGLQLTAVAGGVATTTTAGLTWAACPTLQALAAAVNSLGSNWSAQVVGDSAGDYGAWPSADLYVPTSYGDGTQSQGALTAMRQNAELKMHTYELAGYQWDARGWLLRAIPYTDPELLHPEDLVWPVGINNFRIQYTAGYTTVPEAVQEAAARWVSLLWNIVQRDPGVASQDIPGQISQKWIVGVPNDQPPAQLLPLLTPYRRHSVATNQG